ncbi:MAG TPA: flagellar biosynthesis protein FlhA [Candidatus Sumerlaeota bacterium]|nr:flagellar biosynthesis protein FlhA [Candidatus Sumerlaeota bacterium]
MATEPKSTNPLIALVMANRDIMLPIGVIVILFIMIVPIPPFLIDFFLTLSIASSLIILFVGIYMLKPLDFSVFPSLLLLVTLFRLALNIATTRQILLFGHTGVSSAGKIISTFGEFVVGNSYVVGGVIFLILVVINFVVITKGAGRIAEVSARFTLDAMPGKQMSIDADLNAGLINEQEARSRRQNIEREADFYGTMDGASKFVRGDAIAGILITGVNIIGGLIVGVLQHDMSLTLASQRYTLLTIGDGLVAQIPSLIISTAAGMVVTRAVSETTLGETVALEFLGQPRALYIAAALLSFFGLLPGLPAFPFLLLAGIIGYVAYSSTKTKRGTELAKVEEARVKAEAAAVSAGPSEPEYLESILTPDMISLEVGYGLIPLVDQQQSGELLDRIKSLRRQFALDMGLIVPPIHIRDNLELKPGGYSILIKGNEVASAELMTNHLLAMNAEELSENPLGGIPTHEPAFGLPALWISERDRERAQAMGYTVVNLSTVIATHLTEILRQYAHELLTRQETQKLIDSISKKYPKIVEGVIPEMISLGQVQKVLQNLLRERVSIRDMLTIIETLAERGALAKNSNLLTEYVRQALARSITKQNQAADGKIYLMMLDQEIEEIVQQATQFTEDGPSLAIEPGMAQRILDAVQRGIEQFSMLQMQPIIACLPAVRSSFRRLTEKFFPSLIVLSHNELTPGAQIESVGILRLNSDQ